MIFFSKKAVALCNKKKIWRRRGRLGRGSKKFWPRPCCNSYTGNGRSLKCAWRGWEGEFPLFFCDTLTTSSEKLSRPLSPLFSSFFGSTVNLPHPCTPRPVNPLLHLPSSPILTGGPAIFQKRNLPCRAVRVRAAPTSVQSFFPILFFHQLDI